MRLRGVPEDASGADVDGEHPAPVADEHPVAVAGQRAGLQRPAKCGVPARIDASVGPNVGEAASGDVPATASVRDGGRAGDLPSGELVLHLARVGRDDRPDVARPNHARRPRVGSSAEDEQPTHGADKCQAHDHAADPTRLLSQPGNA